MLFDELSRQDFTAMSTELYDLYMYTKVNYTVTYMYIYYISKLNNRKIIVHNITILQ